MARIKVREVGQGQGERLVVDRRSLKDYMIDVGYPVGSREDYFLVELPRETMSGQWRVLVPRTDLVDDGIVKGEFAA